MACAWNLAGAHAADKDVALPFREAVARIKRHAGDSDRRHPEHYRRLEAFMRGLLRLPRALVRATEAHNRPAVVASGPDDVDLVAAIGSVLVLPHLTGARMDCQA